MAGTPKKQWVRSKPFTWAANAAIPIDPKEFLTTWLHRWKAPTVGSLLLQFKGTISAQTTTIAQEDHCRLWSEIRIDDRKGIRYKASGGGARAIAQLEYGGGFEDPAALTSATTTTYEQYMRIPFEKPRNHRPRDTRMALEELLDGGQVQVTFASADPLTHFNIASGTLVVFASIYEEETREAKVRDVWNETAFINAEDTYLIGGGLRAAMAFASSSDTAGEWYQWSASTNFDFIESQSLDFTRRPRTLVVQEYNSNQPAGWNRTSGIDMVNDGTLLPIYLPERDVNLMDLPEQARLHVKLDGTPPSSPSSKLLTCAVTDRDASATRQVLQVGDAQLAGASPKVPTPSGEKSLSSFDSAAVKRVPVRL